MTDDARSTDKYLKYALEFQKENGYLPDIFDLMLIVEAEASIAIDNMSPQTLKEITLDEE